MDREEFCKLFEMYTKNIDDVEIATRFQISRPTVDCWRLGEAAPHPVGREPIINALKKAMEEKA